MSRTIERRDVCRSHARRQHVRLRETAVRATRLRHQTRRQLARGGAVAVSIAVPIGFLAFATHVERIPGLNLITAIGVLVAISVVLALTDYGRR